VGGGEFFVQFGGSFAEGGKLPPKLIGSQHAYGNSTHREIDFRFLLNQPKSDCIHPFPIEFGLVSNSDLDLNELLTFFWIT